MPSDATTQAGDFTQQAHAYARARPNYPVALVNALIADLGVRSGNDVAEFGAGTGIFTRLLSGRGLHITATDPNRAMLDHTSALPDVQWRLGTFERHDLTDASQHWVLAAQAFHWADPARALPQMRRILRPGGHFTVLWNNRDNEGNPVVHWTRCAISRHVPDFTHAYRDEDWSAVLTSTGDFTDVVQHQARHCASMSRRRYLDLWRSHNRLNAIAGPQRFAAFMADLQAHLSAQNIDAVAVPYLCRAWTARRA